MRRNHTLPAFIIRISALRNMNCFSNLRLRQIMVFPQISDSPSSASILIFSGQKAAFAVVAEEYILPHPDL